jgi:hypothetical protein
MKFYHSLDLPQIPEHLIPDLDLLYKDAEPLWASQHRTATRSGEVIAQDRYARFDISDELKAWVDTNISNDYYNIGLSYMYAGPINLPHTDFTRDVTLIYLFDTGGNNVETKFWKMAGKPLHHENCLQPPTYDDLELIDSVKLNSHCWNILDARCIHSVEGKIRPRISLQLGFKRDSAWASYVFGDTLL